MSEQATTFEQCAIVEIMGHDRYAVRVTEQVIGGCAFVRIDVPECNGHPGFTKLFGQGAIFSITPVSEEIARKAVERFRSQSVQVYLGQPASMQRAIELDDPEADY